LILTAIPLVIALIDALVSLDKMAVRSQNVIDRSVSATRDARQLSEVLVGLERLARQQLVLDDQAGLEDYTTLRDRMFETLARLGDFSAEDSLRIPIREIKRQEAAVWKAISHPDNPLTDGRMLGATFDQMTAHVNTLTQVIDNRTSAETEAMRQQTERARRSTLLRLSTLGPITLALGFGLIVLVHRPIKRLSAVIRRLGDGLSDQPISIRGPRDLEIIAEQLEWLRLRLSEVEAQKTRFLHHVSHELKTPLTAVYEGSQLLLDGVGGALNPEQREIADILRDNTIRLRQLIENLLDYSSIRFQPAVLELKPVVLSDIFNTLARDHQLALTAKHIALQTKGADLTVAADAEKLRVILDNLISNAIKYAPQNSVIQLEARADGRWIIIEVADFGPGVPQEAQQRVFEPFFQGITPADNNSVKGSGLGLSIVKELVVAHGGDVILLNNHPTGSRVRLRLPAKFSEAS